MNPKLYGLTLKEYIVRTLSSFLSFESKKLIPKEVNFDVFITPQFNEKTKEWDMMVVEECVSASRIKFSVEV
jgi:hypothetical protein